MAPLAFPIDPASTTNDRLLVIGNGGEKTGSITSSYLAIEHGSAKAIASGSTRLPTATLARLRQQTLELDQLKSIYLNRLGYELCSLAFPGELLDRFENDIDLARKSGKRLRIHIDDRSSILSGLPWEFLWSSKEGFACINPNCSVVRTFKSVSGMPGYRSALDDDRLHLLIVWADPGPPYQPLDALHQIDTIFRLTSDLSPGTLDIRTLLPRNHADENSEIATLANLRRMLLENPVHILFFLTHGDFDAELQHGLIVLESDEAGESCHRVSAGALETLIASGPRPQVIIFDGCRSASRGPDGKGTSITEAVARQGHSVIGMQYNWPAAACHPFWREFFRMLTVPRPLDECIFSARDYLYRLVNGLPSDIDRTSDIPAKGSPVSPPGGSYNIGDWGFPVMYRNYRPPAESAAGISTPHAAIKRTPDLDHLIQTVGNDVMARLLSLDEKDISHLIQLLNDSSTYDRETVDRLIQREDTLRVLLAGSNSRNTSLPVETSPVWFTHLLESPGKITWRTDRTVEDVRVRLWSISTGIILEAVTNCGFIDIAPHDSHRIPRGEYIRWEVKQAEARQMDNPLVRGIFMVLPPAQASLALLHLPFIQDLMPGIEQDMEFARHCLHWNLYDDILKELSRENLVMSAMEKFSRGRIMANVFSSMHDELNKKQYGDPEGIWAACAANSFVDKAQRLLTDLNHRDFRRGG